MNPPISADSLRALLPGADPDDVARLLAARLHDPFRLLGRHPLPDGRVAVRVFRPRTASLRLADSGLEFERVPGTDLFAWTGSEQHAPAPCRLVARDDAGDERLFVDPYGFMPQLADADLDAWHRGEHTRAHRFMGAHLAAPAGVGGVRFAVWAPNAERVSVVGDFNHWDGRQHPMRVRGHTGVWELFVPGLGAGTLYKYEIRNRDSGEILLKSDPFARQSERRPATASVVAPPPTHRWEDAAWMAERARRDWLHEPLSVYELHVGSWRAGSGEVPLSYRELAESLPGYLAETGFTHVEFMPLTEYPLDESWGYQPTGYFAPTARFGDPDGLRLLIDRLHAAGIGVLLDWVPGHFPRDAHGLARFDGGPLFEYGDPLKGHHPDWGTLVFNYDRREVCSFLISSALYWLEEFHFDGLRVDAVASMLYLDYSRRAGEWTPNVHGSNENLEAIRFLRRLNETTHRDAPGTLTIAEESTAWPGVSRPTFTGGLGFSLKWNMGWMHDTLKYLAEDPVHRKYHHQRVTFGPIYAFTENFMLPLSHDEVVHGKRSLLGKMPGDDWQRFANLRLLYLFQWTYPGKKLLFMGQELAAPNEWHAGESLPWQLLAHAPHAGMTQLVADLNRLYRDRTALHAWDFDPRGFHWLSWDDADNSVLSYLRIGGGRELVVILNFTPVPRHGYRIGVPKLGPWREILNSDSRFYGGSDVGNPVPVEAEPLAWMDQRQSLALTLPPLGGVVLEHVG